jgi:succinate dehydrogenase / fumarate reductase, cytochrome b subunit
MHRNPSRPLSPHLSHYHWGPHMLVSILHRITGAGAAIVGGVLLVWWLAAAAAGPEAYATYIKIATNPWMLVIWVPLSLGIIQHTMSGLRHLLMDIGAGFELRINRLLALATIVASILIAILLWLYLLGVI